MGLFQKDGDPVAEELEKAQAAVAAGEAGVAESARVIAEIEEQISDLGRIIEGSDPDDERALAKLVSRRDGLRGRLEVMGGRASASGRVLQNAREALRAVELEAKRAEFVRLRGDIVGLGDDLLAATLALEARIVRDTQVIQAALIQANGLAYDLRAAGVTGTSVDAPTWATLGELTGKRGLEVALAILTDRRAGSRK